MAVVITYTESNQLLIVPLFILFEELMEFMARLVMPPMDIITRFMDLYREQDMELLFSEQ